MGSAGAKIGMHTFGASAPINHLPARCGFTPEKAPAAVKEQILKPRRQTA